MLCLIGLLIEQNNNSYKLIMYHVNAQTVIDNETKYRGGIRIGNFAEEILAKDYQTQIDDQNKQRMGQTMNKTLHGLGSSALNYKIEQKTR